MNPGMSLELSAEQFDRISDTMQTVAGIRLPPGKETLVRSRLSKRLRALGLTGFEAYLQHIDGDGSGAELAEMVDALTTNKTSFFRESSRSWTAGRSSRYGAPDARPARSRIRWPWCWPRT